MKQVFFSLFFFIFCLFSIQGIAKLNSNVTIYGKTAAPCATTPLDQKSDYFRSRFDHVVDDDFLILQSNQFKSIQKAIDAASSGDTIAVCPGVYKGTLNINKSLTIYGIYGANVTIITGNSSRRVVETEFFTDVSLKRLSIVNGSADDGAGIENLSQTLSLTNMIFEDNHATDDGGAIYSFVAADITISSSRFSGNTADGDGGAINSFSSNTISSSRFLENAAGLDGGAIHSGAEVTTISSSQFSGNTSGRDGGAIDNGSPGITISSSQFSGNTSGRDGGAFHNLFSSATTIIDSTFTENAAASKGGGINMFAASLQMNNSVIKNNVSTEGGGGAYISSGFTGTINIDGTQIHGNSTPAAGAGVYIASCAQSSINNSEIHHNSASQSGGGLLLDCPSNIINSDIYQNSGLNGAGVFLSAYAFQIIESHIHHNVAQSNGAGIYASVTSTAISKTTIDNNLGTNGGGVYNAAGTLTLINATLVENAARENGGGFFNGSGGVEIWTGDGEGDVSVSANPGTGFINATTIVSNTAAISGAGIYNEDSSNSTLKMKTSLVSANTINGNLQNCGGSILSQGYNLDSGNSCSFTSANDLINTDPLLSSAGLASNGGNTQTIALTSGSPAIDTGSCIDINGATIVDDQRSIPRPQGNNCDMGAFEAN